MRTNRHELTGLLGDNLVDGPIIAGYVDAAITLEPTAQLMVTQAGIEWVSQPRFQTLRETFLDTGR